MRSKNLIPTLVVLGVLFIALGDRFLPQPLSTTSYNTRTAVNNSLMGLFPQKRFKNPNERTEKALEQQQGGTTP